MSEDKVTRPHGASRRWMFLGIGVLAVLSISLVASRVRQRLEPPVVQPVPPLAVKVEVIEPAAFAVTRSYVGTIEAVERVVLSAEITGRVLSVPRREGQLVESGQLLVEIDDEEESREIGRLRAALRRLQADRAFWEKQLERDRSLFEGKSISQEKLEDTVRRLEGLQAGIQESEQVLALAAARRAYGRIKAPFAGLIQAVMIHPGELAIAGRPLLELVGKKSQKAVANVPQVDLAMLEQGLRVRLSAPSLSAPIDASVDRVYPALDVVSRTATIEIFLPSSELRPGMVVTLEVFLEEQGNALLIPRQALHTIGAEEGVFVALDGVASWRPVVKGAAQGGKVVLASGIVAGDAVIVTPNPQLKDRRSIQVWDDRS